MAGVDRDTVELDFLLSRVGTEPAREQLAAFARKGAGVESDNAPGFYNLCSLKAASWKALVDAVESTYGGFEGYVTRKLRFTSEDLATIKKSLVTK